MDEDQGQISQPWDKFINFYKSNHLSAPMRTSTSLKTVFDHSSVAKYSRENKGVNLSTGAITNHLPQINQSTTNRQMIQT